MISGVKTQPATKRDYWSPEIFTAHQCGLVVKMSYRDGGVSEGEYDSLNLGLHVGDDSKAVLANRQLVCQDVGTSLDTLVGCQQCHGTDIVQVTAANRGQGAHTWESGVEGCDGLITQEVNLSLMILTADCLPIIIFDPKPKTLGAIHAGRMGLAKGILKMAAVQFGSPPQQWLVSIGPGIHRCCYESDLYAQAQEELQSLGVPSEHIEVSPLCTSCDPGFFSYRRDTGHTGRMATLAWITP
jgi:copper oxidase (laccase) domain-containing protein